MNGTELAAPGTRKRFEKIKSNLDQFKTPLNYLHNLALMVELMHESKHPLDDQLLKTEVDVMINEKIPVVIAEELKKPGLHGSYVWQLESMIKMLNLDLTPYKELLNMAYKKLPNEKKDLYPCDPRRVVQLTETGKPLTYELQVPFMEDPTQGLGYRFRFN